MQSKDIAGVLGVTALILTVPWVAMQFSNEVNWDLTDFAVMGALLISTGLLVVLTLRKVKNYNYRVGVIVALLAAFLLIWAELAVGVFGTPFAGS